MARYLVYTSPARGHLYPIVPTLQPRRGGGSWKPPSSFTGSGSSTRYRSKISPNGPELR